jgi:hypothetical protein
MKRHQQILAGVLVVQIILSIVVFWPKSAATSGGEPVFPDIAPEDVVKLVITDENGNSVTLRKNEDQWSLPETGDYPVQADKVTPVLEKLLGLNTDRLVTRTEASHKQLQVAEQNFVRRVDIQTVDETQHTIYIGSSPRYAATHFRVAGDDATYLSSDISTWELNTSLNSWINTSYFTINKEDLVKVTLENANGTFTMIPDPESESDWTLQDAAEGEPISANKVSGILNKVTNLNMLRPLGVALKDSYGIEDPIAAGGAIMTLETAEKTVTLKVGTEDPDANGYVVKSTESPYYVLAASYNMEPLVTYTRQDFMAEPTPTPAPEESTP